MSRQTKCMEKQPDKYYVDQVLNGNKNAFAFLVEKYKDMIYSIALKVLKNSHDAEEAAQETLVKAYRSLTSYRGDSKFSTWLYRIAYNTAITELRKRRHESVSIDETNVEGQHAEEGYKEFFKLKEEERKHYLGKALGGLSEEEQVMMSLYYFEENSMDDVALVTGHTVANVKIKVHRARKKLFNELHRLLNQEMYSIL